MSGHRHGGVAGPLILIAIGAAFLLNNVGLLSWSAWGLLRLWPLILMAIGIDLLVGRRSVLGTIVAALLIAALLGGGLWLASTSYQAPSGPATQAIHQSVQGVEQAQITLRPAVGELRLSSLPQGAPELISGSLQGQPPDDVSSQFGLNGAVASFRMETTGAAVFVPAVGTEPGWDLRLNADVPIQLMVEQGLGDMQLDLSAIKATELRVNLGIGQINVRLPGSGQYRAAIDGAIGDTTIDLPPGLEAKITMNAALARRSMPDGFIRQGNQYISPGYASAENRVDLTIGQAIGNVTVRRSP
jgi:hypothetical protein